VPAASPPADQPRVYSRKALRAALGCTARTLAVWIRDGKIPPPSLVLSHKRQYWLASTIDALLAGGPAGKGVDDAP
jgi:hypothetical protein